MKRHLARLLREPLFHFLLIGLAIFAGNAYWRSEEAPARSDTIVVGEGERAWLRASFEKQWKRAPTPKELDGLTREYVRETAFYREALAMGLDRDDTIIRRRLAQKLEFLVEDLIDVGEPSEKELEEYFGAHHEDYRQPDVMTFTQVFIDPDKRGAETERHALAVLDELRAGDDPATGAKALGDPFMLQDYYPERTEAEVSKLFGDEFAQNVGALAIDAWEGPVLSGYGMHLVRVHDRRTFAVPAFAEVRDRVVEDWEAARRQKLNEEYRDGLLEKYTIVVEGESTVAGGTGAEGSE